MIGLISRMRLSPRVAVAAAAAAFFALPPRTRRA
jgi:hypothetical protein